MMSSIIKFLQKNWIISGVFVLLFGLTEVSSQITINGPSSGVVGSGSTFSLSSSAGTDTQWVLGSGSGGAIITGSNNNAARITFTKSGTIVISATILDDTAVLYQLTKTVSISGGVPDTPDNPILVSNDCGAPILQRSGFSSSTGDTWYWQGKTSNGTFTNKGNGGTYVANEGPGTYYIRARSTTGEWSTGSGSISITSINSLHPGEISVSQTVSDFTQVICYESDPYPIYSVSSATNGDSYSYQWEVSSDNFNWSDIAGATGLSLNPSDDLQSDRWYRRKVISCGGQTAVTNSVHVSVRAPLDPGEHNPVVNRICYGGNPPELSATNPSNGSGYSYQWQVSIDNTSWVDIENAQSSTYDPPAGLTVSTYFKRIVTSCGQTAETSNPIFIDVAPELLTGQIQGGETICSGGDPSPINNLILPSGGKGAPYTYSWWYSLDGENNWTRIVGEVNDSYDPGPLNQTHYYKRGINSCLGIIFSDSIAVVEVLDISSPTGTLNVEICSNETVTLSLVPDPNSNTIRWYNNASGGEVLETGVTFTTGVLTNAKSYYASSFNSTTFCESHERTKVDVTIGSCSVPVSDPQAHNYFYERTYQYGTENSVAPQRFILNDSLIQQITYFDGLGRPKQRVDIGLGPNSDHGDSYDVTTHIGYDSYGRQEKDWLPYPDLHSQNEPGSFRANAETATKNYYINKYENEIILSLPNPYSQKYFEASPLNRVLKQAAPGNDWAMNSGHEIEFGYSTNTDTDQVRQFEISLTEETTNGVVTYIPQLTEESANLMYSPGELYKTITYNENHDGSSIKLHSVEEFTDKHGRVVLNRTYALVEGGEDPHDTYYVYDDFGNLTNVLPPKIEATTSTLTEIQVELDELGYQYVYDHRNRLVEKKIPGKGWEYIVYNKLDQPVMTQDSMQRTSGEWLFTKYDAFGRVAFTGKSIEINSSSPSTREYVQSQANAVSTNHWVSRDTGFSMDNITVEYDSLGYPNNSISEVLTINYYDDYAFNLSDEPTLSSTVFDASLTGNVRGLATGSKIKVLDPNVTAGQETWITTITRYDGKGRPIYSFSKNDYLGTMDIVETDIDFVGKPLTVRSAHTRNGITIVTIDNFEYDHVGRLLKQTQCIGDGTLGYNCEAVVVEINPTLNDPVMTTGKIATESITVIPSSTGSTTLSGNLTLRIDSNATSGGGTNLDKELIAYNKYDELGQLVQKKVGGVPNTSYDMTDGLQTVDYAYNIRGWLKSINKDVDNTDNDLFNFGINYNDPQHGGTPLYNGNISETEWNTQNTDNATKWYTYRYDALNRLEQSFFGDNSGNPNVAGRYSTDYDYDKNGNITDLSRTGDDKYYTIDVLSYTYYNGGNRLKSVSDMGTDTNVNQEGFSDGNTSDTDYDYDGNGNMISDTNKGITDIEYNHMNLPINIITDTGNISYVYDAKGTKLKKIVGSSVTSYAGGYVYSGNTTTETLQFLSQPEGYATPNGMGGYDYVYQYKDHLGNVRLSYQDIDNDDSVDGSEILQERNYYPFGLEHQGYNGNIQGVENNHMTYQGQEHEEELGKETYAFQWRDYDPAIARFNKIDRYAEKYYDKTPYHFSANNPIRFTEVAGDSIWINYKDEKIRYEDGKLYNRDGTAYNGKGIKTKKDGTTKLKGFLGKAVSALNSIRTGGESGDELVGDLQDSEQHVFIGEGSSNTTSGFRVSWNPSGKSGGPNQTGGTSRPSFVGLAHELGHAHDGLDGVVDRSTWVTTSTGKAIPNAEIYASHWENRIRSENGLPLRTHYSIDKGTNLGGLLNNYGASKHFSRSHTMPTIQFQAQGNSVDGTFRVVPVPGSSTMVLPYKYD